MSDERRKQENEDIIRRMRAGESLSRILASSTWFQPRPIIKKDPKEMARVLNEDFNDGKLRPAPLPDSDDA